MNRKTLGQGLCWSPPQSSLCCLTISKSLTPSWNLWRFHRICEVYMEGTWIVRWLPLTAEGLLPKRGWEVMICCRHLTCLLASVTLESGSWFACLMFSTARCKQSCSISKDVWGSTGSWNLISCTGAGKEGPALQSPCDLACNRHFRLTWNRLSRLAQRLMVVICRLRGNSAPPPVLHTTKIIWITQICLISL